MINHARTLLVNQHTSFFDSMLGNEYVPDSFVPVSLDTELAKIKSILLPDGLDPAAMNYIASVIMQIAGAPDLEPYLRAFDDRITYADSGKTMADIVDVPVSVIQHRSDSCDIEPEYIISGTYAAASMASAGKHSWTCRKYNSTTLEITHSRGGTVSIPVINPPTPYRSKDIVLVPNFLTVYFGLPSEEFTGTFVITFTTVIAPPYDIADRLKLLSIALARQGTVSRVFKDVSGYEDSLLELERIWTDSSESILRFGAVVLAYLIQLEGIRLGRINNG